MSNKVLPRAMGLFFKMPYLLFIAPPNNKIHAYYLDAVHFQRGIQNFQVRSMEVEINIPAINGEPDYNLIQKIWWAGDDYVNSHKQIANMGIEMRILRGSNCTLAPQFGYDFVCSVEMLRTLNHKTCCNDYKTKDAQWMDAVSELFEIWKSLRDSNGKPGIFVLI
jgi:hypothetical protein